MKGGKEEGAMGRRQRGREAGTRCLPSLPQVVHPDSLTQSLARGSSAREAGKETHTHTHEIRITMRIQTLTHTCSLGSTSSMRCSREAEAVTARAACSLIAHADLRLPAVVPLLLSHLFARSPRDFGSFDSRFLRELIPGIHDACKVDSLTGVR